MAFRGKLAVKLRGKLPHDERVIAMLKLNLPGFGPGWLGLYSRNVFFWFWANCYLLMKTLCIYIFIMYIYIYKRWTCKEEGFFTVKPWTKKAASKPVQDAIVAATKCLGWGFPSFNKNSKSSSWCWNLESASWGRVGVRSMFHTMGKMEVFQAVWKFPHRWKTGGYFSLGG